MTGEIADELRDEALAEGRLFLRGIPLTQTARNIMTGIPTPVYVFDDVDLRKMEVLGSDYERRLTFYYDHAEARLYVELEVGIYLAFDYEQL